MDQNVYRELVKRFEAHFGSLPTAAAYAPGRVEVLGNHTDYNEGFVLSAAINRGTFFAAAPRPDGECRLVAGDIMKEVVFPAAAPAPARENGWANYSKGVFAKLSSGRGIRAGFNGMFLGNVPLGAGLSSSAALEVSTGLALCALYGIDASRIDLAKAGQAAEHEYAGVKCGLLDQITSLFAEADCLVLSDFRSLEVRSVPLGHDMAFLVCNTRAKHSLVDSEYNERRARCEEAARYFSSVLPHPVRALRDVSSAELGLHAGRLNPIAARRAAHVIGENERVTAGARLLAEGRTAEFGRLMFESHESSRVNFENSCTELDTLVTAARATPSVLGARLSGGGFGGSVVALIRPSDAEAVQHALTRRYEAAHGHPCEFLLVQPSAGARGTPSADNPKKM